MPAGQFRQDSFKPAAGQQLRVDDPVLLQVAPVPLPPEPNRLAFTLRQGQAGAVIVSLQLVPQAVAFIVLVLVHAKILQYNIFTHMPLICRLPHSVITFYGIFFPLHLPL